jgi:hypothetical protein
MEARKQPHAASSSEDRSLGTLLSDLTQETTTLVQQEVALARAEMAEKVSQVGNGLAILVIGGLILFAGLLKLLDAAIYGLGKLLPPEQVPWLAAVIVGGIVALIGLIMLLKGRSALKPKHLAPQRTAASLQRDKEFVKEHVR